ncbi:hypothetical protein [Prosthecochloris sp. ZM]|uniref:hypothetical protein n=1 Tax=Prosthecochloris sp. ZM TaxID=2283143 RepID=UPI0011C08149|nr:hypothetical protein [Prosthecochloris sp. ZM]
MALSSRSNIVKNLWRFFEILFFFMVSVLGYTFLAKTSVNAKSKSREHLSRPDCVERLYDASVETLYPPFVHSGAWLHALSSKPDTEHASSYSAVIPLFLPVIADSPAPPAAPNHLPAPHNLFQQNPVLLN